MLKRKVYSQLLEWKERRHEEGLKKCLLIKGARQVGKSYIVREFGKNEYDSFIIIDFFLQPALKTIFEGELSGTEIAKRITANMPDAHIVPGKTLIFLDEIQRCGSARTALKFLAEDMRFDVIASGSLLGLSYGDDDDSEVEEPASIPVGYEDQITMYSLDFEEFLWMYGYSDDTILELKEYMGTENQLPESIHNRFEDLFREFMVVGGMPEAVSDFATNKDFNRVMRIQQNIIVQYQDDISKHAKGKEKQLVRMCYDAIPVQLAKELKKFQYSTVEKGQTRRKYGGSIKWLKDSSLVNACYNVSEPYIPLIANEKEEQFKLYINDTGLLTCMYGFETKRALLNNSLKGNAKGGIYENIIAECLVKRGYSLHYYKPDDDHELEFIIEKNGEVIPIEVKSGNTSSASLNNFIESYSPNTAYKLISNRNGKVGVKETLPHYYVMFM